MDSDLWASRLEAVKRQYNLHHQNHSSRLDQLSVDDYEVDDEVRSDFPCPYCYAILDIEFLCSHLEDEHSLDSRVTVCPICSSKDVRGMLSHIKVQHGHIFRLQRSRRLRKIAAPSSESLSVLGRDLRDAHLQALLRSGGGYHHTNTSNATTAAVGTDPLLSSFILSEDFSNSVADSNAKETVDDATFTAHMLKPSFDTSLNLEEREMRLKQADFVQALVLSTLVVEDA